MALWGFGAKCLTGWSGVDGYPLDCYDYQSTCGAKNSGGETGNLSTDEYANRELC